MKIELSQRMQAVADMVPPGYITADVGCDHGFVSIYLIQHQIAPHVYAADVRTGPLSRAREHIAECGLEESITTVLSDGLVNVPVQGDDQKENVSQSSLEGSASGAEVMIAAGMGGRLTVRILEDSPEKTRQLSCCVLEPQSEVHLVRRFLKDHDFIITDEKMVLEDGKYYPVIRAANRHKKENAARIQEALLRERELICSMQALDMDEEARQRICELAGTQLLYQKDRVLLSYAEHILEKDHMILGQLSGSPCEELNPEKAERIRMRCEALETEMRLYGRIKELIEYKGK